jgi:GDPmannose 4,6-dehydratase
LPAKRALVTGVTGQDGAYLSKRLLESGYKVFGTYRRLSTPNFWRLQYLGVFGRVSLIPVDLGDMSSLVEAIRISSPREIYNLAAQSFVGASFEQPLVTADVSGVAALRLLEAVRQEGIDARFYQASTSEMFGYSGVPSARLDAGSRFAPMSPYAAAKLYGHWAARIYRDAYKIYACSGVLFNHESPLRGLEFVTRKITNGVAKIKLGMEKKLLLGNMAARRDWGYAPEYVDAIWRMLQQETPADYVIASGVSHSVKEFVQEAFDLAGLDWEKHVSIDRRFLRPLDVEALVGDPSAARGRLGWKARTTFKELVALMLKEDVARWTRWQKGEHFPWDAPNYPSEARILTRTLRM